LFRKAAGPTTYAVHKERRTKKWAKEKRCKGNEFFQEESRSGAGLEVRKR
jgi:hypothetical protein